nr:hypothetical protein [uncultured Anaeromusa sp.]
MLNQLFGNYLLNQGLLEPDQICEALRREVASPTPSDTLPLFQSILDRGYLPLPKLEQALREFRRECESRGSEAATGERSLQLLFPFLVETEAAMYLEAYVGLLLRNTQQFLAVSSYLAGSEAAPISKKDGYVVTQKIYGDQTFFTGLRLREKALLELASRFYGERLEQLDDLALDCVGEFLNVHNGAFCSLLSGKGVWADLEAQQAQPFGCELQSRIYRLDIGTSFGPLEMLFAVQ